MKLGLALLACLVMMGCAQKTKRGEPTPVASTEIHAAPIASSLPTTAALGDTGYVVTLPPGFTLKEGFMDQWDVWGSKGRVASLGASREVTERPSHAVSANCGDAPNDVVTRPFQDGLFLECEEVVDAIRLKKILYIKKVFVEVSLTKGRADGYRTLRCSFGAEDVDVIATSKAICTSLTRIRAPQ